MELPEPARPLLARVAGSALFRAAHQTMTAHAFARTALRIAAELPDGRHVVNLCQDRGSFALVLAAAILRGQTSLCTADRSPDRLRSLAERYPAIYSVSNEVADASPLRHAVVDCTPDRSDASVDVPMIPSERPVAIVFTSGTTGEAVGNTKCWGALVARSEAAAARFGWQSDEPADIVATVPPQHMYGIETSVLLPLHAPVSSWCGTAFFPDDIRRALAACDGPRCLVTTPLQLQALLRAGIDLPPLRTIISATAPLDPAIAEAAERRWGTEVFEIFGATEIGSVASRRTTEGDVWTTYPGITLQADVGGLSVRTRSAPPHPLGDIVEELDSTHFRLLGRRADVLKLGGRRASLAGLNAILNRIEGVADGVFVPPDDLDRRPTARMRAFAVSDGASADEILTALRRELDPVFLPRRVVLVPSLPRNELGKLTRAALDALQAACSDV